MARNLREPPRGLFRPRELSRIFSALLVLAIVGLVYVQARSAATWSFLAQQPEGDAAAAPVDSVVEYQERIVPDAGRLDEYERDAIKEEFQAVSDKSPLTAEEMAAHWRLMRWAMAEPSPALKANARTDLMFTHLWEDPEKHRGELITFRLHVRRVLRHDAPQNSAGATETFEAWGVTEDSQTYPYCVVFPQLPPQMPLGPNVFEDAQFTGFFLKQMSYEAHDIKRSAPLLIGRITWLENPARKILQSQHQDTSKIFGLVFCLGLIVWGTHWYMGRQPPIVIESTASQEQKVDAWLDGVDSDAPNQPPVVGDVQHFHTIFHGPPAEESDPPP